MNEYYCSKENLLLIRHEEQMSYFIIKENYYFLHINILKIIILSAILSGNIW